MPAQKSTTVRFYSAFQVRAIRTVFGLAERFAPELGGRWAERLWFTLPPRRLDREARRAPDLPEPAARVSVPFRDGRIKGDSWGDDDSPLIFLVHGWGGWRSQLDAFVAPLVAAGFRVVSFDAPSHGESSPGAYGPVSSTLLEAGEAVRTVADRLGPAYGVVAHSAGACAVTLALRDGVVAKRVVFVSPMEKPEPYTLPFAAQLGFGERVRKAMIARSSRRIGVTWDHFDLIATADQLTVPPTLVIHDRDDTETNWSGGAELAEAWPGARLMTTEGLGHNRILIDPAVVKESVGFLLAEGASSA
ncbi:alpha/beta hydrolase [Flindersiella endophytica]